MPSGNQVIQPTSGKVMSKVTVQKPATLLPENIKKDVVIGGVTGTLEGGGSANIQESKSVTITSNGTTTVTPDTGYDALSQVDVTVNVASSALLSNIITFEYAPTDRSFVIAHETLVGVGIDTEDKFFKIIGISIIPKNGDIDWFYVGYGGTLDKTEQMQSLTYNHKLSGGNLAFYNIPSYGVPYSIGLQTQSSENIANKTFIITLLLSE